MHLNEVKLAQALRSRDETAMGRIMDRYARLLWTVAGKVLDRIGTVQDVEEVVADTFVQLWEHPEKFDPHRGSLKTYLSILARTQAVNRCREIARHCTVSLEDTALVDQLGVAELVQEQEDRTRLREAVRALKEPEREILIRRYFYEQKPRQIALAMELPVKQVDNYLYRSKRKLRQLLTERGDL